MTEILSDTRYRRAELTRAEDWKAVAVLDAAVIQQARCPECGAEREETCRTTGKFKEARTVHYDRMRNRDRQLRKGFGS